MAWRFEKVEEQRKNLAEAYWKGTVTMTDLCREFGISRKTGYKWCKLFKEHGVEKLCDRSRAPKDPHRIYPEFIIDMALDLKLRKRNWGPRKILSALKSLHPRIDWPSATYLYEIFKKNNLVLPRRLRGRVPATHPLGDLNKSNDVWCADFKGWFLTQDNCKCEPLTISDGYSRYLLKCIHLDNKSCEYVWPIFAEAFKEYGLPNRIRTDNGSPFGSAGAGRLTKLSINFIKAGVVPEWTNPGHPEENGRHERIHLTLKQETASPSAETIQEQIYRMMIFQQEYNFERPHESLNMEPPSKHYCKSPRTWDGILRAPEYDTQQMIVRKVGQNGCIWIKQSEYYVSQALEGEYVGVIKDDLSRKVYYGPVFLGELKEGNRRIEKPKLKPKKIIRR